MTQLAPPPPRRVAFITRRAPAGPMARRRAAPKAERPHRIADRAVGAFAKAYVRAAAVLRPDLDTMTRAIASGVPAAGIAAIPDLQNWKNRLATEMLPAVHAVMAQRMKQVADAIDASWVEPGVDTIAKADPTGELSFTLVNPYAVTAANTAVGQLVTSVSDETVSAIQAAIANAIQSGIPPRQAAGMIAAMTGLNNQQMTALLRYRTGLQAAGMSSTRIDRLTSSYGSRLLQQRGMMIARTETIRASVLGTQAAWQDQIKAGNLDAGKYGQVWVDTGDSRECPICADLASQDPVPFGQPFGGGDYLGPPAHPMCRCDVGVALLPLGPAASQSPVPDQSVEGPPADSLSYDLSGDQPSDQPAE